MQPPGFWQNPCKAPGLMSRLLGPLSWVWRVLTTRRLAQGPWHRVDVPVICVGNLSVGGTGKTPTAIALVEHLTALGKTPHVVSRGYGGSLPGPLKVDARRHKAHETGDEPLLLAGFCPTWVARDRYAGTLAAIADGADVIVMDDGFQNPSVHKDLSIVVVDAVAGFGNGRVIPAGPLREPVETGLARADGVMIIGPEKARAALLADWPILSEKPVCAGKLDPLETGIDWKGMKVLAFAGIGRPEKFFATLRALGADIYKSEALSDHQPLTRRLMQRMENESFFNGAQMVTTEKDATRLPEEFKLRVISMPVRLRLNDEKPLETLLAKVGLTRA